MNKILIGIWVLLGSILIVTNFAINTSSMSAHIIIWYTGSGLLSIVAMSIWFILWIWVKWYLSEKWWNDYNEDEWMNF